MAEVGAGAGAPGPGGPAAVPASPGTVGPGRLAAAGLLAVATAAAYATSFRGGFQFDDWNVIVEDRRVQSLGSWWQAMPGIRPLLKLSYALNHQSGLGLAGFHAFNLAVHLGAALLAMALLARLEGALAGGPPAPGWADGGGPDRPRSHAAEVPPAALLGALLFALHPAQTEAVTYLSGRSTALAALLCLASTLAWLDGRARGRAVLTRGLSPLLFLAALGVKETAAALPAALLLLGAAIPGSSLAARGPPGERRGEGRGHRLARRPGDTAVHWLLLAGAAAAWAASPVYRGLALHAAALRPPGANLVAHLDGLGWLAGQVLLPWRLAADPWLAPAVGIPWGAALAALGVLGLAWFGLRARRRAAGVAVLWLLLWLPASGWLLPRPEPANDRQLYLALLGPAWLAGRWLARARAAPGPGRLAAGLSAAALLGSLGVLTARRNLDYRDEVTFWSEAAAAAPGNARALNNLGLALSAACRLPEATQAFEAALAIDPRHPKAGVNLWLLQRGAPPGERPGQAAACPP